MNEQASSTVVDRKGDQRFVSRAVEEVSIAVELTAVTGADETLAGDFDLTAAVRAGRQDGDELIGVSVRVPMDEDGMFEVSVVDQQSALAVKCAAIH